MKIGINARTFSVSEPGGAIQSSKRLTTELIENTDHDVILFGDSSLSDEFNAEIDSTGFLDNQIWGVMWERMVLPWLIEKIDVDVLYCPNGNAPLHKTQTPVVMCIHDVNAQKGWSGEFHELYRKLTVPIAAQKSDALVTVSEFSKNEITDLFDIADEKVHVVYNGIDSLFFENYSESVDLPERYLLFVGSLNPRKNIEGVLRAFKKIRAESNIVLVFVGPKNKNIFQDLEIESMEGIRHYGYLDMPEVKFAYEHAEALIFPSFYEGFGLPPLESLACGTPVVASDRGALPEILDDVAVFVNPDSPSDIARGIRDVLDGNPVSEAQMRLQAEKYTWESVASQLTKTLNKVT